LTAALAPYSKELAVNPDFVAILVSVFRQAVTALPPEQQTEEGRLALAARIMTLAECGECDPDRLLTKAVTWANGAYRNKIRTLAWLDEPPSRQISPPS
jgi:hypothetical protein